MTIENSTGYSTSWKHNQGTEKHHYVNLGTFEDTLLFKGNVRSIRHRGRRQDDSKPLVLGHNSFQFCLNFRLSCDWYWASKTWALKDRWLWCFKFTLCLQLVLKNELTGVFKNSLITMTWMYPVPSWQKGRNIGDNHMGPEWKRTRRELFLC